jgi:hypothetical protein
LCFLTDISKAQNPSFKELRTWDKGELTWDDFQGKSFQNIEIASELHYFFNYQSVKNTSFDTTTVYFKVFVHVDTANSWVNPLEKSKSLLAYNQVIFDICELYCRKFQVSINQNSSMLEINTIFQAMKNLSNNEIKEFDAQSFKGRNEQVIKKWSNQIRSELDTYKIKNLPPYRLSKAGMGMFLGVGYSSFNNSLTESFKNPFYFIMGFDFPYKKWTLYWNMNIGGSRNLKEFEHSNYLWERDKTVGFALLDFSVGYPILNKKLKITPFAGFGFMSFSLQDKNNRNESYSLLKTSYVLGLNFDYTFSRTLRFNNLLYGQKEYNEFFIRGRIFTMPIEFNNGIKGNSINIGLSTGGLIRFIRTRMKK